MISEEKLGSFFQTVVQYLSKGAAVQVAVPFFTFWVKSCPQVGSMSGNIIIFAVIIRHDFLFFDV